MKKVVVLGAKGMLGTDIVQTCEKAGVRCAGMDLPELDITRYDDMLAAVPDCEWIINCAAYTRVDDAESDREAAYAVNCEGARNVARICAVRGISLLHVSTDYVFDGATDCPYREDDPVNPINTYGASKLAGEDAIREELDRSMIVRTQALFGAHGRNFVQTIMRRITTNTGTLRVVDDQTTSPTYTAHLAQAILCLLDCGRDGTVHVSASNSCTWFEFTQAIVQRAGLKGTIEPVSSSEMKLPAERPPYAVLDKSRYTSWTGRLMPTWQEGLEEYLRNDECRMPNAE